MKTRLGKSSALFLLAIAALFLLSGCEICFSDSCGDLVQKDDGETGPDRCAANSGRIILKARTTYDNYEAATMSFKYGTTWDNAQILNDWDLLFGNDRDPEKDTFTVNMVTDDESFIVDLGQICLCQVPERLTPDNYPQGLYYEHDNVPVRVGHTYLVRNADTDTRQVTAFQVVSHDLNDAVTIQWHRSSDPTRFVAPAGCQ